MPSAAPSRRDGGRGGLGRSEGRLIAIAVNRCHFGRRLPRPRSERLLYVNSYREEYREAWTRSIASALVESVEAPRPCCRFARPDPQAPVGGYLLPASRGAAHLRLHIRHRTTQRRRRPERMDQLHDPLAATLRPFGLENHQTALAHQVYGDTINGAVKLEERIRQPISLFVLCQPYTGRARVSGYRRVQYSPHWLPGTWLPSTT